MSESIANLLVLGGSRQMSVEGGAAIVNVCDMVTVLRTREVDAMASGRCTDSYDLYLQDWRGPRCANLNS